MIRISLLLLSVLVTSLPAAAKNPPSLPPLSPKIQIWDAAKLLSPAAKTQIVGVQKRLKDESDIALWVVLLDSQKPYQAQPSSVESFARTLAREKVRPLAGNDDFILLLICKSDRTSRIELGSNWRNQWNEQCDVITRRDLVPNLKAGKYEAGVSAAVTSLADLARTRRGSNSEKARDMSAKVGKPFTAYTLLSAEMVLPAAAVGVSLFLLSLFASGIRLKAFLASLLVLGLTFFSKPILALGFLGLIAAAPFLWLGNVLSTLFGRSYHRRRFDDDDDSSSWSSGSSSNSGSGSGSGGGSTGSW